MKKLIISISALAALGSPIFAGEFLTPVKTTADLTKLTTSSAELKSLKFDTIYLYPQTTVKGNDAEANKKFDNAQALKAEVAVLANERDFSVVVRWSDTTNSTQNQKSVKSFGDAVALQIPQNCSDATKLPYIGMGSEGRAVTILLQKNTEGYYAPTLADISDTQAKNNLNLFNDDLKKKQENAAKSVQTKYQKVFVAEGFRTTTEVKEQTGYTMDMSYTSGKWTAVFTKKFNDDYSSIGARKLKENYPAYDAKLVAKKVAEYSSSCDVEPIALAVWDGAKDGRNGNKWLSSWTPIKLKDSKKSQEVIAEINKKAKGDIKNGKKLASENCSACHTMGDMKASAEGMGPNLSNIGGYSTAAYLRESIVAPHAVIVPGLNANRSPMQFYAVDSEGKRTSNMPAFDTMAEKDIEDIVTFLQTLKAGGAK